MKEIASKARWLLAMATVFVCGADAQASVMTGVTLTGPSGVASIVGTPIITHAGLASGPSAFDTGTLAITLNVFKKGTPVFLNFSYAGGGAEITTYAVTLTVNNLMTPATGGGPDYMNGFDIVNNGFSGLDLAGIRFSTAPVSVGNKFAIQYFGTNNIANGFRIGGLSGGGGAIYNGGTAVTTFSYRTNGLISGASQMTFTANPEPATLLLGSLAMIPAAVVARRRRKAAQEPVEAA